MAMRVEKADTVWHTLNSAFTVSSCIALVVTMALSRYGRARWIPLTRVRIKRLSSSLKRPVRFDERHCTRLLRIASLRDSLGGLSASSNRPTNSLTSCAARSASFRLRVISERKSTAQYCDLRDMFGLARKVSTSLATMPFIPGCASNSFLRWKPTFDETLGDRSPNLLTSKFSKARSCSGLEDSSSKAVRMALVFIKVTVV